MLDNYLYFTVDTYKILFITILISYILHKEVIAYIGNENIPVLGIMLSQMSHAWIISHRFAEFKKEMEENGRF